MEMLKNGSKLKNKLFNMIEAEVNNGIHYTEIAPKDADNLRVTGTILVRRGDEKMNNEILHMWVRLFHAACKKWGKTNVECAEIFDKYKIDDYIRDVYGFFHIQGDDANLSDIEEYLKNKGMIV